MTYYRFNRKELLKKAHKRCHEEGGKGQAADFMKETKKK